MSMDSGARPMQLFALGNLIALPGPHKMGEKILISPGCCVSKLTV